jgi:2-oxoglutarate ferredoxin oxidoreductase subunit gamma
MERDLIVAGFGGQGVMMLGTLLAQATCDSTDKNVTYFPSYGAEMRGGTANCYVAISDEEIGAPVMERVSDLIVFNQPSLDRFLEKLESGGALFVNTSIADSKIDRKDVKVVEVPVTGMAIEMGNPKVLNIIMLGAYIGYTEVVGKEVILDAIRHKIGAKKPELLPLNEDAFEKGFAIGAAARA